MRHVQTEIVIDAQAKQVWDILTDFASFPLWNPFLRRVAGEPKPGAKLRLRVRMPGVLLLPMRTTVIKVEPLCYFSFIGRFPIPGIISGEHSWEIVALGNGRVRLTHREIFRGLLVPMGFWLVRRIVTRGFEWMDLALKDRAEKPE